METEKQENTEAKKELMVVDPIKEEANDLVNQIVKADDKETLEDLYKKFNINNTKKNAIRINSLNELLDKVNEQASERFTKRPGEITNKEILDYMNAIQNQIERSQKVVEGIKDIGVVQVNNTQNNTVNINVGNQDLNNLKRESRDKILDIMNDIFKSQFEIPNNIPTVKLNENIESNENVEELNEVVEENTTEDVEHQDELLQQVLDDEFSGDD